MTGGAGWSWHCPAPTYTIPESVTMNLMDLHVINTNKLTKGVKRASPPGPAPDFYISNSQRWWKEQIISLQSKLSKENTINVDKKDTHGNKLHRWRVVLGHHPAEYVYLSLKEHGLWGIRYFPTTFMRGNPKHIHKREGLAHILRREADLYLCGHQHLSAYMKLSNNGKYRPKNEQRCLFAIVGNSSKLDQDDGDFDDDFVGGRAYQIEERFAKKQRERTDSFSKEVFSNGLTSKLSRKRQSSSEDNAASSGEFSNVPHVRERTLSTSGHKRYEKEWKQEYTIGFAFARVTRNEFTITFIEVYKDGGYRESKTVKL